MWPNRFNPRLFIELRRGYSLKTFIADLTAGATVAVIALPLAMALAIASGVKPEQGLYTAIVAGFLISAFGGSRLQIGGPTGAFIVIVFEVVADHGYDGLAMATLMAGFLLIFFGLAGLGKMIKFIPYPVTTGFTAGIALIIFTSQIKEFLGLEISNPAADFLPRCVQYVSAAGTLSPAALLVGAGSLLLILWLRASKPRLPGALIAVVASSAIVYWLKLPVETIETRFGGIPSTFPLPSFPVIDLGRIDELSGAALTIALLAAIESLLSAVVADGMSGDRHDSNTELVAQGAANIASVFFLGIPATGAIARTATNIKSGAKTPVAGIIHAAVLLLFILVCAPLAKLIPLPALAAILFMVAWNMSHIGEFRYLLAAPKSDAAVLVVTFLLTVLVDLTTAVEVGVVMAALLFMKRMSDVADLQFAETVFQDEPNSELDYNDQARRALEALKIPADVEVFQMTGPFFFGVVDRLKDVLNSIERPPKVFILRLRLVPVIDATGLHALRDFHKKCQRQGTLLLLSGVQPHVRKALRKVGLSDEIGEENFCENIDHALKLAQNVKARL